MNWKTSLSCTASVLALLLGGSAAVAQAVTGPQPALQPGTADNQPPAPAPSGTMPTTSPADPAAPPPDPTPVNVNQTPADEIVVTGLRSSLRSAQALKRNSDQILDAVVAEDIGKLPDNNASEALARITGVQVNRSGDEANGVQVRGLPDVTTTFNGREIFTAEGRGVALQDFPAGALAGLEVYKSTTANLVEGGIAGLINVRSRRPFDFDGFELAGAVRGSYNDQPRKYDPNFNLLVTDRWDTGIGEIGALINFSYTQLHYLTSARFDSGNVVEPGADQVVATPGVGRDFRIPEAVGIFYGRGKRWRPSINGAVQWRPADNLEIYAEGLWQGYRGRDSNDNNTILVATRPAFPDLSNVVLDPDDPTKVQSLTISNGREGQGDDYFRGVPHGDTNTYQGAIGGVWTTGRAKLSTDFAYTDSTFTLTDYGFDFAARVPPTVDINFDIDDSFGGVEYSFPTFDQTDPNNMIIRGIFDRRYKAKGKGIQWRNDLELETDIGFVPKFDFGTRYVDRDASVQNGTRYANLRALQLPISEAPVGELKAIDAGFRGSSIQPDRAWVAPTPSGIFNNIADLRDFAYAGLLALNDPAQPASIYEPDLPVYNPLERFDANEKSYAFYGQAHFAFDFGIPIDGIVGARVVNTVNTLDGTSSIAGVPTPVSQKQNYVDVLPNASLRARFTEKLQLRLSATETRTRPGFGQLNPALNINRQNVTDPTSLFVGNSGNINLKPIQSKNYDASLEWYFSRTGSLTGAIFRRDIEGFISNYTTFQNDPTYGRIQITRPENAGSGRIQGAEVAFTTFFDALPGWLSGFGTQLNATYIDGSQALPATLGVAVPDVQIPNVSKWSYNLIALYEKGPISARLAYNYRTRFVNFFSNTAVDSPVAGEFTRGVERLDFSLSVTPVEAVTVTFDATNLTRVPFQNVRNYTDTQSYPRDIRYEGRIFSLGARFRF